MNNKKPVYIDPVCGMEVEKPDQKDLKLYSAEFQKKVYYFCSPFCTATFIDNPERYLNKRKKDENNSEGNSL